MNLVSSDPSIRSLCREITREMSTTQWDFTLAEGGSGDPDADLCLWDYKAGMIVPEDAPWGIRSFVLVASNNLVEFRTVHPYAEAGIVLKPITRAGIRAVLEQRIQKSPLNKESVGELLRSDRDELLQCLIEANLQLQEHESRRSNFLGRALHDFHAPLTALNGYCGMLLEERPGVLTEQQKLIITRMHRSVRRLSRLSRAMFQLSVGRHVSSKPVLRERDIRECVEQALYEIQPLIDEKRLQLELDLEPCTPLLIDASQLEQVLINMIENACKFSPRNSAILVKGYPCFCDRRAKNVYWTADAERRHRDDSSLNGYRIDIADSGPGVLPEQLESIFEEYVSYGGGQDRSRGGLGLAICQMIVHQHEGRIWAENCECGAVFSFVLPLPDTENSRNSIVDRQSKEGKSVATCA